MNTNVPCSICHSPSSFAFEKSNYSLYRCTQCTHLFVYPTPSAQEIEAVYKESYFHKDTGEGGLGYADYDSDKAGLASTFDRYLDLLGGLTSGRNILDVGCATGFFLDRAKDKKWTTAGVEISDYGASECRRRGHDCVHGTIEAVSGEERFDVITMWDVFEHMSDPVAALTKARELLRPDGILVINTVDSHGASARLLGTRWHLLVPPEHLQYYSKKSLRSILEQNSFDVLDMHRITKHFSLAYIFTILYRWQHFSFWNWLADTVRHSHLKNLHIPIQTFDNMYVVARKRL
jgi:2-polyprenyl-3-methyl-5-hydroxy-6-metoxy-1,4-benzoquinol methylase